MWGGCVILRTTQATHTRYGFFGFVSDVVVVAMIGGVVSAGGDEVVVAEVVVGGFVVGGLVVAGGVVSDDGIVVVDGALGSGLVSDVVVVAMIGGVVSELTKVTDVVVRMTTVDVLETPPRGALVFDAVTDVVGCVVIGVVVAVGGFELGATAGSSEVGTERSVRPSTGVPEGVRTTAVDAEGTGGGTVDIVHERGVLATTDRTTFVDEGAATGDRKANAAGRLFTGTGDCATA